MSHKQEPYRLKADSREAIEQAIPFDLQVPARKDYSYHFIGKEVLEPAEYDGDEMIKAPVLSDYVLADLRDYREDEEIDFGPDVEVLTDIQTPMHGWT